MPAYEFRRGFCTLVLSLGDCVTSSWPGVQTCVSVFRWWAIISGAGVYCACAYVCDAVASRSHRFTCSVKRCTKVMQPIRSKLQNSFVFCSNVSWLGEKRSSENQLTERQRIQQKTASEKDLHKTRGRCHAHNVTFFKSCNLIGLQL